MSRFSANHEPTPEKNANKTDPLCFKTPAGERFGSKTGAARKCLVANPTCCKAIEYERFQESMAFASDTFLDPPTPKRKTAVSQ